MSRIVFTNGNFDLLHVGHLDLLTQSRMFAGKIGKVIVALDSDEKIKKDKGKNRPYFSLEERKSNLLSLKYPQDSISFNLINEVASFDTNEELYELIKSYKPDILIKGCDWKGNVIGSDLCEVVLIEKSMKISSTNIEQKILNKQMFEKIKFDPTI